MRKRRSTKERVTKTEKERKKDIERETKREKEKETQKEGQRDRDTDRYRERERVLTSDPLALDSLDLVCWQIYQGQTTLTAAH